MPKRKWTDWSLPGYKYLGPGNALDKGPPNNKNDAASIRHDVKYGDIASHGGNPYLQWSDADQQWLDETNWGDYGGVLGKVWFGAKKAAYSAGLVSKTKDERPRAFTTKDAVLLGKSGTWLDDEFEPLPFKPGNIKAQSLLNLQQNTQDSAVEAVMSGGEGSGNAAGLKETPIDLPDARHPVTRGPPEHTFASLPYYKDRLVDTTRFALDHGFRMTSPYDPEIANAAPSDLNAGAGAATVISVEATDAADAAITSARWFDFYSTLYNYYHVIGARWHMTIQNMKTEPLWCHMLYYNDEVPPLGATNEDIQCWNDTESHLIGPVGHAILSTGTVETNERVINVNNIEGVGTAGTTANYETGNHIASSVSNILKLSGKYRPGQVKRKIHLDSEVENWTGIAANPALPEKLLFRFKPVWNAIDTNDANSYDRLMRFQYTFRIEYLVEFKELKFGLRWPIERQPVIAAVQTNIEEDEE